MSGYPVCMAKTTEIEKAPEVKCDNHPDREGKHYTQGDTVSINLCEECTPPWFKQD